MHFNKLLLFLFASLLFEVSAQSNWVHQEEIDSIFFSSPRVNEPGFGITIIEKGSVVYERCAGMANVARKIPYSNQTKFALASVSKQFTAMCIQLLEENGKLRTNDKIADYIPELPDYPKPITINHLLTHTSGIRDHITMLDWEHNQKHKFYDFEGTLNSLKKFNGVSFYPGQDFAYSNTGFVLLALIVERVSGIPFEQFVKENIFDPLEMNNTQFSLHGKRSEFGYTTSYNWKNGRFSRRHGREVNALGATGVYTTLEDFVKWDQNFYNNILGNGNQSIIERMNTSGFLNNNSSVNYGNGQKFSKFKGIDIIEHSGGWAFYNFQYTRVPSLELSVIVTTNNERDYPIGMVEEILERLIPQELKPCTRIKSSQPYYGDLKGTYIAPNNTLRIVAYSAPGYSVIVPSPVGNKKYALELIKASCFSDSLGYELCFDSKHREAKNFTWEGGMYFTVPRLFERVDEIGMLDLNGLVGKYYCEELGTLKVKFNSKKDKLIFTSSFRKKTDLIPLAANVFKAKKSNFTVRFENDYLLIGNNRVYNVKFMKTP